MHRLRLAVLASALLFAAPAFADDAAPLATSRASSDQIAAFLSEPPPVESPSAAPAEARDRIFPMATGQMSTDDQIAAYLNEAAPAAPSSSVEDAYGPYIPYDNRRRQGEVGVAIGSHGYRSVYARQTMPVGKTGTLDVAFAHSRFRGWNGGRAGATSLGVSLDFTQRGPACEASPWRRESVLMSDCGRPGELLVP
jgi:hypothetical protein